MPRTLCISIVVMMAVCVNLSQSGRAKNYSESVAREDTSDVREAPEPTPFEPKPANDDVLRIETDLVTIPVRALQKNGRPVTGIRRDEFKVFENGVEQEIAYFSTVDEPFTVALMLDMSYSSVFKLNDIQAAAMAFIAQLKPNDRVMVLSFDEKVEVLCEATTNRKALRYAIEAAKINSGTSLYDALDVVLNDRFRSIPGRKAIVLLSDGVDTTSIRVRARDILHDVDEMDTLVYPIRYDTFDDVRKSRRNDAQILYDDNDRPYIVESPLVRGEKEEDYVTAGEFLKEIAQRTGGRVQRVRSTTNLSAAFAEIAEELRKTYSLGYYPSVERKPEGRYFIRVRIYRPGLDIRARQRYSAIRPRD